MGFYLTTADERAEKKNRITRASTGTRIPDGWNMISETSTGYTNFYTWGIDASGSMQGAGGVGGLLSMTRISGAESNTYFYCMDGNGNVTDMVDTEGNNVAHYEYGPFGETLVATGPMAQINPFKFSSKYWDSETGFYYYGMRWYSPEIGRWVNRDPIEESGGVLLYGFIVNNSIGGIDYLGAMGSMQYLDENGNVQTFQMPYAEWWSLTLDWLFETGEKKRIYGPNDKITQEFKSADGVAKAIELFKIKNANVKKCSDFKADPLWQSFSYKDFNTPAFRNPTLHWTGTYRVDIVPSCNGELKITVSDEKTWKSALRYVPALTGSDSFMDWYKAHFPEIDRKPDQWFHFGGTLNLEYWWTEPFDCECRCEKR